MRRLTRRLGTALAVWFGLGGSACAHALAQRYDLPLPLGLFLAGAGAAVAVSFVVVALFWRRTTGDARPDSTIASGTVPFVIVVGCQVLGIAALILVVTAGLFGNASTFKNITPVAVWVIWWVGVSFVSAFMGNIWVLINPWSGAFNFAEWLARRYGKRLSLELRYPEWLGAWPACAVFLTFAWLELVAPGRDVPRNIALALATYSVLTWTGFVLFGRGAWLKGVEAFSVAFGLFGRFAPLEFTSKGRWFWMLRPYAVGLLSREPLSPSMTAFALLMLATVTVDGIMETPLWAGLVETLLTDRGGIDPNAAASMLLPSALLIAGPLALAGLYLTAISVMARITGSRIKALSGFFVLALIPIAIAYYLSHYFSLLMLAGQFIIPLASDPFGYGWDLFGTTLYRIDIGIVDAKLIWYLAATAIVTGHIIAVCVGHVTGFAVFSQTEAARRSQYPILALMVGYTMLSLWIIAQPIVELGAK